MMKVSSISKDQLQERRQLLRRRRRIQITQSLWRLLALGFLAIGVFWGATRPVWLVQSAAQIRIEGNEILSDEAIKTLISIEYPQPLMQIKPNHLAHQLQQRAPIRKATVVRQIFPPRLIIYLQERKPVAQALTEAAAVYGNSQYVQPGLLDAEGVWMPRSSFTLLDATPELPKLIIQGMRADYRQQWSQLYQAICHSPVEVTQIDWRDPSNLVLHTELGVVRLGPFSYRFSAQLAALNRMRMLSEQLSRQQIAYIDLSNPEAPSVQLFQANGPNYGSNQLHEKSEEKL